MLKTDVVLIGYAETENLGLEYLESFLTNKGYNVQFVEFNGNNYENVLQDVKAMTPLIVGFSLIFQGLVFTFKHLMEYLRANGIFAHFTLGGHFPSVSYKTLFEKIPIIDSIVIGEGEVTIANLAKALIEHKPLNNIDGLVYKENSIILENNRQKLIENLDSIPFPVRNQKETKIGDHKFYSIITSRGCAKTCSFCSIHEFYNQCIGKKQRFRSPQNVINEISYIVKELGGTFLVFEDDDFSLSSEFRKKWINEFVVLISTEKLKNKFIWRISCRIDEIDIEILKTLKEYGLISIYIGIESGNDESLLLYNKGYNAENIKDTVRQIKSIDMPFEFGFMHLNPNTTFKQIITDIDFLEEICSDCDSNVCFTKMIPYAGTKIEKDLILENRLSGSIDSPDYIFQDERIDMYQLFLSTAFHHRNFDPKGSVEVLRNMKLIVLLQSNIRRIDQKIKNEVNELITESNIFVIDTLRNVARKMNKLTYNEIIRHWNIFEDIAIHALYNDKYIYNKAMNILMRIQVA